MHDLREQLEGAGDQGLRSDDCGQNGYHQRWIEHVRRHAVEKWIGVGGGISRNERSLPNVGEEKTGIGET